MDVPPPQPASEAAGKPGKVRTWWHPLLAGFLPLAVGKPLPAARGSACGAKAPADRRVAGAQEEGELPEDARRVLAGVAEYLNHCGSSGERCKQGQTVVFSHQQCYNMNTRKI